MMKTFFLSVLALCLLAGCATYADSGYPAPNAGVINGVPVDPTYPGPGPRAGFGIGSGGWGAGFGLGW